MNATVGSLGRLSALAALLLTSGCDQGSGGEARRGGRGDREGKPAGVPSVEAVQARLGQLPVRERLTGTVRAEGQVAVVPQVRGPITAVLARNGDEVKAGQPLVRIRAQTSSSQLDQARAAVDVAQADAERSRAAIAELEATFARTQALADEKLVSPESVETERARLNGAQAALAQALARVAQAEATVRERQEAVGQTVVRSPISGRVGDRRAEVGMLADPSAPLFTVGAFDRMRVDVDVPQELLPRVRPGKAVEVRYQEDDPVPVKATVSRVSPFLSSASFSARAEIDVDSESDLMPGMFVTVDVLYGQTEPVTLVPRSALVEHPITGGRGAYVAASLKQAQPEWTPDGTAPLTDPTPITFVDVTVVEEGASIAGVSGLDKGAWVLVVGQHLIARETSLAKGVPARVRPVSFERVVAQQRLQRDDLMRQHLDKQQRIAREKLLHDAETDSMKAEPTRTAAPEPSTGEESDSQKASPSGGAAAGAQAR